METGREVGPHFKIPKQACPYRNAGEVQQVVQQAGWCPAQEGINMISFLLYHGMPVSTVVQMIRNGMYR